MIGSIPRRKSSALPYRRVKLSADDPITSIFPTEEPRYPALAAALSRVWRETRAAMSELRDRWFEAAGLTEPAKNVLTAGQRQQLDSAIAEFLRTMAGEDRSQQGYAAQDAEDGILQQAVYLAHQVGVARAVDLTGSERNLPLDTAQRQRLASESFRRLSVEGRLRFETRLSEIRDAMDAGFRQGANPLSIARKLGRDLGGYEQGRLRTLVRTEMGIASEQGMRDLYRRDGVQRVEVIGDPGTDELCTLHIGQVYPVGDMDNLPLYHPNCFCSTVPAQEN